MRVHAQKQSQPQQEASPHATSRLTRHTIVTTAEQASPRGDAEGRKARPATPAPTRFGHDFGRIPVFAPVRGRVRPEGAQADEYEREADRAADQVLRLTEPQAQRACACGGVCPKCQERQPGQEPGLLQTKRAQGNGTEGIGTPPVIREALDSPGHPLDSATRAFFEPRFGRDFDQVRLHTSTAAARAAASIKARAFTVGHHIVFGAGRDSLNGPEGRRLLAHELTHTLQQQNTNRLIQRAPSFEDCSTAQETVISAAITTGAGWVRTALRELRSALGGSMSAHTGTLLTRDFHTHSPSDIRQIVDKFDQILAGLTGSITYECESWCMGEKCGYVYGLWTDVHFCPSFFSSAASATFQARCLVHELAHKEAGAGGDTYEYDAGYASLTAAQAIDNADSYAVFARDI